MKYLSNDMPFYSCYLTIKSIAANLCESEVELLLKLRWLGIVQK
jgi:hypothetical protein